MELVEDREGQLLVVLAGHPTLDNDLRRPIMEEIGYRTEILSLHGITGIPSGYIHWLLETCTQGTIEVPMIEDEIDLLTEKLRTPLQIQLHLSLSLEAGYLTDEKRISSKLVESLLSRQRDGYRIKGLVEQLGAKPTEIKA
jgi:type II secretory pathway predicted ATPase ExeA